MRFLYAIKRWMYRHGRPNALARLLNQLSVVQFSASRLAPRHWVTLEVVGRRTGAVVHVPMIVVEHDGERYLVAMLGERANWVRNVRSAGGRAAMRHGGRTMVELTEVDVALRPTILRHYLEIAPGARPHFPISRGAPLSDFGRIAPDYPVFRIRRVR